MRRGPFGSELFFVVQVESWSWMAGLGPPRMSFGEGPWRWWPTGETRSFSKGGQQNGVRGLTFY